jgi:hypothetical protein
METYNYISDVDPSENQALVDVTKPPGMTPGGRKAGLMSLPRQTRLSK